MAAQMIPVAVHALDQFDLAEPRPGVGLMARLGERPPVLRDGRPPVLLPLLRGPDGLVLAEDMALSGHDLPAQTLVTIAPLPVAPWLMLLRAGGKPVALAVTGREAAPEKPGLLPGLAAGTLIDTPDGPRAAETLGRGDLVTTLANGSRPLRWVARRRVLPVEMLACPALWPRALPAGLLANDRPLLVSAEQRVLIDDWRAEVYFGEDRVLVAAGALHDHRDDHAALSAGGIDYVLLMCEQDEILVANGALVQGFHPGNGGLAALTPTEHAGLFAEIPEEALMRRRSAYPIVSNAEARAMRL